MGITLSFIGGSYISYPYRPIVFIIIPIIFLIWVITLPNTPQYYLQSDKFLVSNFSKIFIQPIFLISIILISLFSLSLSRNCSSNFPKAQKAAKALKYYKGCEGKSDEMKAIFKTEYQRLKANEQERRKYSNIELKDFQNRMALKGFVTSIAMAWLMQTTGIVIITNFASLILEQSGTSLGVNASSIILALMQIVGGLMSTQLGDISRKTTLYISLSCSAFGLFTFSLYSYLRHCGYDMSQYLWVPLVSMSFIILVSSAGIVALCNTLALENFSPKVSFASDQSLFKEISVSNKKFNFFLTLVFIFRFAQLVLCFFHWS